MSILGDFVAAAVGGLARMLRLKRVKTSPLLDGPVHVFPPLPEGFPDEMRAPVSYYALHVCRNCGEYIERRAAYTTPPCRERLPSGTELP